MGVRYANSPTDLRSPTDSDNSEVPLLPSSPTSFTLPSCAGWRTSPKSQRCGTNFVEFVSYVPLEKAVKEGTDLARRDKVAGLGQAAAAPVAWPRDSARL